MSQEISEKLPKISTMSSTLDILQMFSKDY